MTVGLPTVSTAHAPYSWSFRSWHSACSGSSHALASWSRFKSHPFHSTWCLFPRGAAGAGPAISAFQKAIRGDCEVLRDHICKEMNELNLERCRCIPKGVPGADWRVLQEIVAADPQRALVKARTWAGMTETAIALGSAVLPPGMAA